MTEAPDTPAPHAIAVLGVGASTAAGAGMEALWTATLGAPSLARPVTRYDVRGLRTTRAALLRDDHDAALRARWPGEERVIALCLEAIAEATQGARLDPDLALYVGTSLGGVDAWEPWHRALVDCVELAPPACGAHDEVAPRLAAKLGLRGPAITVSTACTSGATALILAADALRDGAHPGALVVAVDVLGAFVHSGFDRLGALSPDELEPAPFAPTRSGLWLGEGSAAMLLGRGVGVANYLGGATAYDGVHMTAPDREGRGLRRAIVAALRDARLSTRDVALLSAHGTGTVHNDAMERAAFASVFGEDIPPVHALKPVTGHTLGASGLIEAAMCVRALREGLRPPTRNSLGDNGIVRTDTSARALSGGVALSVNAAMAGHNAAVLLGARS